MSFAAILFALTLAITGFCCAGIAALESSARVFVLILILTGVSVVAGTLLMNASVDYNLREVCEKSGYAQAETGVWSHGRCVTYNPDGSVLKEASVQSVAKER